MEQLEEPQKDLLYLVGQTNGVGGGLRINSAAEQVISTQEEPVQLLTVQLLG
jgi:hypothetical protein